MPHDKTNQQMQALAKANAVRLERGKLKKAIRDGQLSLEDALNHPALATYGVFNVLHAQHRWGRDRTLRALRGAQISESRRVGTLTERERTHLVYVAGASSRNLSTYQAAA